MRDVFPVLWKRTLLALQKIWRSSDLEKIVTLPGRSCHRNDIAQSKGKEEETHYLLSNFLLPICLIVMPCTKYVLSIYPRCKSQRCEYHRRLHRCHFKRHILPQCPALSWTSLSKTSCSFLTEVPSVSLWANSVSCIFYAYCAFVHFELVFRRIIHYIVQFVPSVRFPADTVDLHSCHYLTDQWLCVWPSLVWLCQFLPDFGERNSRSFWWKSEIMFWLPW